MALLDIEAILLADYLVSWLGNGGRAGSCLEHRRIWLAVPLRIFQGHEHVIECAGCEKAGVATPID